MCVGNTVWVISETVSQGDTATCVKATLGHFSVSQGDTATCVKATLGHFSVSQGDTATCVKAI